jgi:two-component system LytT family response regulator
MIRAFIVDDERLARVALRDLLLELGSVEVVGEADSVAAARERLASLAVDVVFLDVQMPGGSGFELVSRDLKPRVVFCTAYEHYAVRAFEVNALDYVVKPATPEALSRALSRVRPAGEGALERGDLVALREAQSMRFVSVRDIVFILAADDYSEVHLTSGVPALVDVTLRRWEERLPASHFVRVHRSSLVNLDHVEALRAEDGQWRVHLRNAQTLQVSRRVAAELKKRIDG